MFSGLTGPPLILMYEMLNVPKVGLDVGGLLPREHTHRTGLLHAFVGCCNCCLSYGLCPKQRRVHGRMLFVGRLVTSG